MVRRLLTRRLRGLPADYPHPSRYVRPVDPAVRVTAEPEAWVVRWASSAQTVSLRVSSSLADVRAAPLFYKASPGETALRLSRRRFQRAPFVCLTFVDATGRSRSLLGALREIDSDGVVNLRDAGGYLTQDGAQVRWRVLFRSGHLADAPAALEHLGLNLVCDMRSGEEAAARPDVIPDGARYWHRPFSNGGRIRQLLAVLGEKEGFDRIMLRGYTEFLIDRNAPVFGEILEQLALPESLPALLHCTAGKDRTGITVALLLAFLGVPRATIVADYSLSNHHFDHFKRSLRADVQPLLEAGVTLAQMQPVLSANPALMEGLFAHIDRRYGSVASYLRGPAGVSERTLKQLRTRFLYHDE